MNQMNKFKLLYAGIFLSLVSWVVEIVFGKYMEMASGLWLILNILLFLAAAIVMTVAYYHIRKSEKSFMTAFIFGSVTIGAVLVKLLGLLTKLEILSTIGDLIIGIGAGFAPYFAVAGIRKVIEQGQSERSKMIIESGKAIQWCFGVIDVLYAIAPIFFVLTWIFKLDLSTPMSILNDFTESLSLIGYGVFTHFVWECTMIDDINL